MLEVICQIVLTQKYDYYILIKQRDSKIMSKEFDLNLVSDLQKIGLSDKEALVYMGLLEADEVSPIALSRDLGLHRQYIYNALSSLKERGLVVQLGTKRARWKAQSPRKLIAVAEDQANRTNHAVEQLLALQGHSGKQEFEVTEGRASFRARQLASIRKAPEGSTVRIICGKWKQYFDLAGEMDREWDAIRRAKGIFYKLIGPESLRESMKEYSGTLFEYRTLPHLQENLLNTVIYENEVVNEVYGEPHITFGVTNPEVAKSQREFFETLWNLATPGNK
jgi:sugar-specific transcriptional regulator TrmB